MSLRPEQQRVVLRVLWGVLVLTLLLCAGTGSVFVSPEKILGVVLERMGLTSPWAFSGGEADIVWLVRLPRVVMSTLIGGSLAVVGAALQGLFRNPLADPGLIGVSSGGTLGAALVIVLLPASWTISWLPVQHLILPGAAFLFGVATTILVYRLASMRGRTSVSTMLLAGVAINALAGAIIGFLTYISDDAALRSLMTWSLGSFGGSSWETVGIVAIFVFPGAVVLMRQAEALNVLLLGESEANHLGVDVARLKRVVIVAAALVVGAGVGFTGMIGFVGLIVPHALRLLGGPEHRWVLPGSALCGALLLLVADLVARTVAEPAEMPIGLITALLGAPFFLWLMLSQEREG